MGKFKTVKERRTLMLFKTDGLTKKFGGLTAVDDLTFHIDQGEIVSVIGPNGAGKTTVFNLITGVHRPTEGRYYWQDEDITGMKPHKVAKKGIARTFQLTTVFAEKTVFDNLVVGHHLRTRSGIFGGIFGSFREREGERQSFQKAEEILDFVELGAFKEDLAGNIPQEAQKRLSVGIALTTDPKLLLLDEPTSGVNIEEDDSLIRIIKKIRDIGITICLIEHKMKVVMGISDRLIVLSYGRMIAEGAPEIVSQDEKVIEAYLGPGYAA